MMKIIIIVGILFLGLVGYSSCVAASIADDTEERLYKEYLKGLDNNNKKDT